MVTRVHRAKQDPPAIRPTPGHAGQAASRSSTPVWASTAKRSGTPQCSTMRPSRTRHTSITVKSTGPAAGRSEIRAGRRPLAPHANPDGVPGLHGVLDRELNVWEGPVHVPHGVLDVGDCVRAAAGRAELVVQEVGRAELVGERAVAGGEALVEYPLHHRVRGRAGLAGDGHLILPKFLSEAISDEQ